MRMVRVMGEGGCGFDNSGVGDGKVVVEMVTLNMLAAVSVIAKAVVWGVGLFYDGCGNGVGNVLAIVVVEL